MASPPRGVGLEDCPLPAGNRCCVPGAHAHVDFHQDRGEDTEGEQNDERFEEPGGARQVRLKAMPETGRT